MKRPKLTRVSQVEMPFPIRPRRPKQALASLLPILQLVIKLKLQM